MDGLTAAELKQYLPNISDDTLQANVSDEVGQENSTEGIPRVKARLAYVDPAPAFKSKTEARAWRWVDRFNPVAKFYELVMFRLPGGNYTPDFLLVMPNAEKWYIEVKGKGEFKAYQSGRSSKKALKEAAHRLAWDGRWFVLIEKPGGGWHLEELTPHE